MLPQTEANVQQPKPTLRADVNSYVNAISRLLPIGWSAFRITSHHSGGYSVNIG